MWICTQNGLNNYNALTDDFDRFYFDEKNIHTNTNLIGSVAEDPNDNNVLWAATAAGLIRLNKSSGNFKRYTTKDGLSSNLVISVLSGNNNSLWMSTVNGISSFNIKNQTVMNFYKENGFEIDEFTIDCYYKDFNDNIYLGGTNGFTYFHPDSIKIAEIQNKVFLTDFYSSQIFMSNNHPTC